MGVYIFLLLNFFIGSVYGDLFQTRDAPFQPALAADQAVITSKTLTEEAVQFRWIGLWLANRDKIKSQDLVKKNLKIEYERALKLHKVKQITDNQLLLAKNKYDSASFTLEKLRVELNEKAALGEVSKWKILGSGNPSADYRADLARTLKTSYIASKKSLEIDLKSATAIQSFLRFRKVNGERLFKKSIIAKVELERRELAFAESSDKVRALEFQIQAKDEAQKALEKSLDKL